MGYEVWVCSNRCINFKKNVNNIDAIKNLKIIILIFIIPYS